MTQTQSDICDDIGISFLQGRHDWSDLIIGYEGKVLSCRISRIFTDDLAEMVRLAEAVLDNQPVTLNLMDEPGGHRLSIRPDLQQHHIVTFEMSAFSSRREIDVPPLMSIRVKRKQLLTILMTELWKLHFFHQEPAFQRARALFSHSALLRQLNNRWDKDPRLGPSILK